MEAMSFITEVDYRDENDLDRVVEIVKEMRARRLSLAELIGTIGRLERELNDEVVELQALAAEGRLIMLRRLETP